MLTLFARFGKMFAKARPQGLPAWLQAIGMELELRYDVAREPLPETMSEALGKLEHQPAREACQDRTEACGQDRECLDHDRAA